VFQKLEVDVQAHRRGVAKVAGLVWTMAVGVAEVPAGQEQSDGLAAVLHFRLESALTKRAQTLGFQLVPTSSPMTIITSKMACAREVS